jgi:hypothetical protein
MERKKTTKFELLNKVANQELQPKDALNMMKPKAYFYVTDEGYVGLKNLKKSPIIMSYNKWEDMKKMFDSGFYDEFLRKNENLKDFLKTDRKLDPETKIDYRLYPLEKNLISMEGIRKYPIIMHVAQFNKLSKLFDKGFEVFTNKNQDRIWFGDNN